MWLKMYVRITSKTQGAIEGESAQEGREKLIVCYGINHAVELPWDKETGHPGGAPVHHPLVISTGIGAHTPRVIQACCAAEPLEVEVQMYRINRMGEEEPYLTMKLTDAIVVDNHVRYRERVLEENRACEHVEDISFTYGAITCRYAPTKLEVRQSWLGTDSGNKATRTG
jgi:type VI secretion system Hcp family effector